MLLSVPRNQMLQARAKEHESETSMLRSQLECSLEANHSIQRQLDEVQQTTRLLDEQAITKANQVMEEFAKIEPKTPRTPGTPGSPGQRGWV